MGLDMWAFATSQKPGMPVDFGWPEDAQDFHTWRWAPKSEGYSESSDSESDDDLAVGSERSDSQLDDDLAFITKARDYLARGLTVYYTCWW